MKTKKYLTAALISITLLGAVTGCGPKKDIGKDRAAEIALEDARLAEADVTRLRVSKDREDGQNIYEVTFTGSDTEYEYEILSSSGEILSADYDKLPAQNTQQNQSEQQNTQQNQSEQQNTTDQQDQANQQNPADQQNQQDQSGLHTPNDHGHSNDLNNTQANVAITLEEASQLALDRVPGASLQDLKIELDYDDGIYKYEGDIIYDQKEYEFEIDANTGEFLEWKEERR